MDPRQIREQRRPLDGGEVEISQHDGDIEIVPVAAATTIVDTPDGPVAVAPPGHTPLTDEAVSAAIDATRR